MVSVTEFEARIVSVVVMELTVVEVDSLVTTSGQPSAVTVTVTGACVTVMVETAEPSCRFHGALAAASAAEAATT